jgi:hypothetical protein
VAASLTKQKVQLPPPKAPREKARELSTLRRWLRPTLVAMGALAALVAIGMLVGTLTTPDTGNVVPKDTAIIHDDAGNMAPEAGSAIIHDDAGSMNP